MKMLRYEIKVIIEARVDCPDEIADELEKMRCIGEVEVISVAVIGTK